MSAAQQPDTAAIRQILEERARVLAQPPAQAEDSGDEKLVVFRLGDTCYGLPAQYVKEAYPLSGCAPLPGTPAFVLGLVNVRGRLLTALDLRPLLGLPPAAALPGGLLLIVAVKSVELALYTDAVLDVRRRDNEIAPAPSNSAGSGIAWLLGVDRAFTLLIDPVLLLADPRLIVNTSA